MIILTGGAGFIGSCLVAELNSNNIYDIIVVDNLGKGDKWKNLANKKISQFLYKDTFREIIRNNTKYTGLEAIVHLGACSSTTETDVNYLMDNNFLYSKELADYCINNKIRFIYASSAATYGNGENGYSDESIDNLVPLNKYGFSKHLFDMYIKNNGFKDNIAGIKFFNVFGPNEAHKGDMRSMVFKAYKQIVETGKVKLFKSNNAKYVDGGQMRDFIYVKDCVKVIMQMLNNNSFNGIYNLGTGAAKDWNSLVNAVFSAVNRNPNIEYIEMPEHLSKQYQNFTEADTKKLLSKLGKNWQFTSLEDAVKDYVCNYLMKNIGL
jgi:ADP-L-glycero-D-manno-heptose 6-epimerase